MNSTSPAHSSVSTTAIVGGGSVTNPSFDEFQFPSDLISIHDRKEEAFLVLKADLMATLNKEVKSLDEDNWKFEGPRSCIHLISRPGGFPNKKMEITKSRNLVQPKNNSNSSDSILPSLWWITICKF
ncbi:protein SAMBA isoform X1 [Ricinus communis]|uniref:protein SAMBA isoform X1 n=1 Tax=Ricinus communis TaxID=3988 RepID=UPI00201ADBE0|nr:protein SAMBA isoform X1 [Ricinus communis]